MSNYTVPSEYFRTVDYYDRTYQKYSIDHNIYHVPVDEVSGVYGQGAVRARILTRNRMKKTDLFSNIVSLKNCSIIDYSFHQYDTLEER